MGSQQSGEGRGLGLTQLGKLLGDVRHRAVVLADLFAVAAGGGAGAGCVSVS